MADITHGTWIKYGKAVDAAYQNGVNVYRRNYFSVSGFIANKYMYASIDFYDLQLLPNTKYTVSTNNAGITDQGYANVFSAIKPLHHQRPIMA